MHINSEEDILDARNRKDLLVEIMGSENKERRDAYLKRHEIYHDRQKEYVLQLAQEEGLSQDSIREMANRMPGLSILRKLINKKARVYARTPERKLAGADEQQQLLDDLAKELELDMTMKKTNRWLELHKNVLVHVKPIIDRDASREAGGDKFRISLEVWNPAVYDVLPDPQDETKPLVVIFSWFDDETSSGIKAGYREGDTENQHIANTSRDRAADQIGEDGRFVWWSPNWNFTTDGKGQIIEELSPFPDEADLEAQIRNPIGRLPFVNFCKDQDMTYWAEGGEDLVQGATLINLLLADLYFISKYQGMGILTVAGKNVPKQLRIGPNRALTFDMEEGDPTPLVNFASSNPPIAAHIQMIEQLVAMLLTTNDLEPGSISGTLNANNAASGIQEIIQRSEPTSAIEDDQAIFIAREPRIIQLVLAWIEALQDTGVLADKFVEMSKLAEADYTLMLPEPEPFANEEQRINAIIKKLDAKLITKMDAIRLLDPDMDMEAAKAKLEEIKAESEENAAAFGVPKMGTSEDDAEGDKDNPKNNPFEKADETEDE